MVLPGLLYSFSFSGLPCWVGLDLGVHYPFAFLRVFNKMEFVCCGFSFLLRVRLWELGVCWVVTI